MITSAVGVIASIGVNTHMDASTTPYGNPAAVAEALKYLGINTIRDHAYDIDLPAYTVLAARGIRFDLMTDENPAAEVAQFTSLAGSVRYFEGANEINMNPVPVPHRTGVAAAVTLQRQLYAAVKASPVFRTVPVIDESLGGATPAAYRKYKASQAYADFANVHTYMPNGHAPSIDIPPTLAGTATPAKIPSIVTETGYYTLPQDTDWGGVSEAVQASYTLDTVLDDICYGVKGTFIYELYDEVADPAGTNREAHFGLFDVTGAPKLAANALHNLTTILSDPATATTPPTLTPALAVTVSGLPDTGNALVMTKANGLVDIAVWAEPPIWDPDTHAGLDPPASTVTVALGQSVETVRVYDPMSAADPITTYHNVSSVTVGVTDHPVIIEADNTPATPAPVFAYADAVTGLRGDASGSEYTGPVSYLQQQYLWNSPDAVSIASTVPNVFLHGGAGDDALQVSGGQNVLDGGAGSNFLVGARGLDGGTDTFFLDGRGGAVTWSTVVNFHKGDTVTLFGFMPGISTQNWTESEGADGYRGVTLHSELGGAGTGINASLTIAGLGWADVQSRLSVTTGAVGGATYLEMAFGG